jgi:hypothetical protein
MSTVQAWQSVVQQMKELRKLAGRFRQHEANGSRAAAAGVADSMNELCTRVVPLSNSLEYTSSPLDECEEIVMRLKVGRLWGCSKPSMRDTRLCSLLASAWHVKQQG